MRRQNRFALIYFYLAIMILNGICHANKFAPPLKVNGNKIYDANDKVVQLRGFAVYDATNWTKIGEKSVANWKNNWKINTIRLALHPWNWYYNMKDKKVTGLKNNTEQDAYLSKVDTLLKWCRKYEIYVVFDGYHESGDQGDIDFHWPHVQNVWPILAKRYKDQDHILWNIYNEPYYLTWDKWLPKAEKLIDIIKEQKPLVNVFVVPGANWAQDVDARKYPVNRDGVIYQFHTYPHVYNKKWDEKTWDSKFGYIVKEKIAPVYIGEFHIAGHRVSMSDNDVINQFGKPILKYYEDNGINYSYWGYFPGWGNNLVDNQISQDEKRSTAGEYYYNHLRNINNQAANIFSGFDDAHCNNQNSQMSIRRVVKLSSCHAPSIEGYGNNDRMSVYSIDGKYFKQGISMLVKNGLFIKVPEMR